MTTVVHRSRPQQRVVRYGMTGGPYIVAHRGGAGIGPENTMAAFGAAMALGVRYLETDVRSTRDGVALAFHDATFDRVTNGTGRVVDATAREAASYLVSGSDEGIPRLDDVLGSFPGARFMIDLKEGRSVEPLAEAIRRTNSAGRVCVAGAWDVQLRRLRMLCGKHLSLGFGWRSLVRFVSLASTWPGPDNVPWMSDAPGRPEPRRFAHVPWQAWGVDVLADAQRRARVMAAAHRHDIGIMAWTIDDPADAEALLDAGVTGVITDRPDLLRPVWEARGIAAPMGRDEVAPW